MAGKKPSRRALRFLCAQTDAEDGIHPRLRARNRSSRRTSDRKTQQLGHQVADTLGQALADLSDDVLQSLYVVSAEPAPNASRFVVTVSAPPAETVDALLVLERLDRASARLRAEVAAAITRKRAPLLVFHFAIAPRSVERQKATL
jgi:ribosome-binding factor A